MDFTDRVVLITGAGSGIGRASALAFAQAGAYVVVTDLDADAAERTAAEIPRQHALALAVDVTQLADNVRMIEQTVERFGRLDVLHLNAGTPQSLSIVEDVSFVDWQRILAVNLTGVFLGAQQAAPLMKRQRHGVILVTASMAALRPRAGLSAYAASKGGVIAFVKALALELAPFQVRVNAICPVAVPTPMLTEFHFERAGTTREEHLLTGIPLGRFATTQEVAAAALYLASDGAAAVTGTALQVDCGRGI